jgi:hypothetical protein
MVNGVFALWDGQVSGDRSGRVIRLGSLNQGSPS